VTEGITNGGTWYAEWRLACSVHWVFHDMRVSHSLLQHTSSQPHTLWSLQLESVRKDVECTFGILKLRFQILVKPVPYVCYNTSLFPFFIAITLCSVWLWLERLSCKVRSHNVELLCASQLAAEVVMRAMTSWNVYLFLMFIHAWLMSRTDMMV
jgi:hypothetical protein